MTCHATTDGPRRLPCVRPAGHAAGHVFDCGDVDDHRHDDITDEEQTG